MAPAQCVLLGAHYQSVTSLGPSMDQDCMQREEGSQEEEEKKKGEEEEESGSFWSQVAGDKMNLLLLLLLYTLQGLPIGLAEAIPLVLTERKVSYGDQAQFNSVFYPFSCKLLWAPLVDSLFIRRFGRRKSWLIPAQVSIGVTMLVSAQYMDVLLGEGEGREPNVGGLLLLFLILNFLAATQDVAVDGWALTLLRPANLGLASSANTLGQTIGWLLGYSLFTWLESQGILQLSTFLTIWGSLFLVTTLTIAVFKTEVADTSHHLGLLDTYKVVWKILRHPLMVPTVLMLLTYKVGFSTAEVVTSLKLVEFGVPRSTVAVLELPMVPVKVVLTLVLSKWVAGRRPLTVWLAAFLPRLLLCLALAACVYWADTLDLLPTSPDSPASPLPLSYQAVLITVYSLHLATTFAMQLAIMAFFARVSDPLVGGTYMTFLNTMNNLGTMWPRSAALALVGATSSRACLPYSSSPSLPLYNTTVLASNTCDGAGQEEDCEAAGGHCVTVSEGYYSLAPVCVALGCVFLVWGWRTAAQLQREDRKAWRVVEGQGSKHRLKYKYFYCA